MLGSLRIDALLLCLCVAMAGCNASPPSPPAEAPKAGTAEKASEEAPEEAAKAEKALPDPKIPVDLPKLEYVEMFTGGAKATDKLPMVIMVHGLGGHPKDMREIFSAFPHPARIILPQGPKPYAGGFSWFDIARPIEGDDPAMSKDMARSAAALALLIEKLVASKPTAGAPIITGFSQGGAMSFVVAVRHGKLVRMAMPIAGWLPKSLMPPEGADLSALPPIHAFHGEADDRVLPDPTKEAIAALHAGGAKANLSLYPSVAHAFTRKMRVEYFNILLTTLKETP